jgi:predicted negative regulator of RcsB-dependent stress response
MEVYETEEQQWEAIKSFFKKYGNKLLWVAIIIMGSISAVRYWQHHQYVSKVEASELYSEMLISLDQKDNTAVMTKIQNLKSNFDNSTYATLGSMIAGKIALKEGEIDSAKNNFNWAIEHSSNKNLKRLAQFRLMKVLMVQGDFNAALDIAKQDQNGLMPLFKELEGDIRVQQEDFKKAKEAYTAAMDANKNIQSPLLKLKLEDLGVEVE